MTKRSLYKIDAFDKNIILVFFGTSIVNLLNFFYQFIIAHRFTPENFAAFNSLLSVVMLIATPISALQPAVIKYISDFNAQNNTYKIRILLSTLFKKILLAAAVTFIVFILASSYFLHSLKIYSALSGYILATLLSLSWASPVFIGALQGLELFKCYTLLSIAAELFKLLFIFVFLALGFGLEAALGALVFSSLLSIILAYFPLKNFIAFKYSRDNDADDTSMINLNKFFSYIFPVAFSSFCFIALVSLDMILVKYFFTAEESGLYSLAQMPGKVFLFLPLSISTVMFPRISSLNAQKMNTVSTLTKSLLYTFALCLIASLTYNIFPALILKTLTGKVFPESIFLGRLFSISMTFFAMLYIFINYFLSRNDLRFIKYLAVSLFLQILFIVLFHKNLAYVQLILCINAIILFFIHLTLVYKEKKLCET